MALGDLSSNFDWTSLLGTPTSQPQQQNSLTGLLGLYTNNPEAKAASSLLGGADQRNQTAQAPSLTVPRGRSTILPAYNQQFTAPAAQNGNPYMTPYTPQMGGGGAMLPIPAGTSMSLPALSMNPFLDAALKQLLRGQVSQSSGAAQQPAGYSGFTGYGGGYQGGGYQGDY